jgi:CRISPR-associated endonuclease Csy4
MIEAKLRRLIQIGSIEQKAIKNYKAQMFNNGLDNPYFELDSISTGHNHRRYIQFGKLNDNTVRGQFDFFGLSTSAFP